MFFHTLWRRLFQKFLKSPRRIKNSKKIKLPLRTIPDFKKGDLVQVLSKCEIKRTLDINNRYKGLLFSEGMWKFCGKKFRIFKKLKQTVMENTGEVKKFSDTYLLEDNVCDGLAFRGCSRECYWFWKGIWLKKL